MTAVFHHVTATLIRPQCTPPTPPTTSTTLNFVRPLRLLRIVCFTHRSHTSCTFCTMAVLSVRFCTFCTLVQTYLTQDLISRWKGGVKRSHYPTHEFKLILKQLDYCNFLLYGITEIFIERLKRVLNSLVRIITRYSKYSSIGLQSICFEVNLLNYVH